MGRFGQPDDLATFKARSIVRDAIEIFRSQNATGAAPRGVTLHLARRAPRGTVPRVPGETPKQHRRRVVAANLRRCRRARGLTQEQLAERIGVERPSVVKWERARWEPSAGHLEQLAAALGVEASEFYREEIAA
jgi:DNA-binding XRE family transcriptional regulator